MRSLLLTILVSNAAAAKPVLVFQLGDLANGEVLIKKHCGGCDAKALHDPMNLAVAGEATLFAGLRRGTGKGPLSGWDGTSLHELDAWDIIRYLRVHSIALQDLAPTATHFSIEEATPNQWGRDRLVEKAKLFKGDPTEAQVRGKIIATWVIPGATGLTNVSGDTSIIGGFARDQKSSFALLRSINVKGKTIHVGLALDRKTLQILAARAVPSSGGKASKAMKSVDRGCRGKGRRDNYRRFNCSYTGSLARPIWKAYILGSEQIYAYEIEERENDFGADLD